MSVRHLQCNLGFGYRRRCLLELRTDTNGFFLIPRTRNYTVSSAL